MKLFASILFAALAVVTPGYAQTSGSATAGQRNSSTDDVVSSISGIHRPTPTPGAASSTKAAGPLEVTLAKDAKGNSPTTTFAPGDTAYFLAKNVTAKKGDKIGVAWYGGKSEKKVYGSDTPAPNDGVYNPSYNLPPPKGGSPAGNYRVELLVNGKALKSVKFTVK